MTSLSRVLFLLIWAININTSSASTVIFISGGTGSGKTSIAKKLEGFLHNKAVIISQDSYYKDLSHLSKEDRGKFNFDHPDSIEFDLLEKHIVDLKKGESAEVPTYDFTTHNRTNTTSLIQPKEIIIVEGILLLAMPKLRDLADIKIFVDVEDDERLLRRIKRDIEERGRSLHKIQRQYLTTVKPMHQAFVAPSKQFADIIIPKGAQNNVAIDLLVSQLKDLLLVNHNFK